MPKPITQPTTAPFLGMLLLRRGKKGSPAWLAIRPAFYFGIPPLTGRNSPLKSRNVSLIHYVSAGFG